MATKLKTGVEWPAFEAKVHGWAMDKPVIVVRLHGVSPESTKQEIEAVMAQYGDVLDMDIGYISKKVLPGVTNGTWTVKMIMKEGKTLPSFVFMKEEGEVWQVTHENQVNVCWKCGQSGHVGARCSQPTLTFDALDEVQAVTEEDVGGIGGARSWAHVVKSGIGQTAQTELERQENLRKQFKEDDLRRDDQERAAAEKVASDKAVAYKAAIEKKKAAAKAIADEKAKADKATAEKNITFQNASDSAAVKFVDQVAASMAAGQFDPLDEGQAGQVASHQVTDSDDMGDSLHVNTDGLNDAVVLLPVQPAGLLQPAGPVGSVGVTGKVIAESEFGELIEKNDKNKNKKLKVSNTDKSDISEKESFVRSSSPSVRGIRARSWSDSQATSKEGLTPDDLSINSQATSKGGITQQSGSGHISDADHGMVNDSESFELKKIVPDSSLDSSSDSSPRHHKPASGQLGSPGLPNNTRSVQNREWKADIVKNDSDEN